MRPRPPFGGRWSFCERAHLSCAKRPRALGDVRGPGSLRSGVRDKPSSVRPAEAGPGDHFSCRAVADAIRVNDPSDLPASFRPDRPSGSRRRGLRDLARGGVYIAPTVTSRAVRSYRTLSPLPVPPGGAIGGLLSAALALARDRTGGWALPTTVSFRARTFLRHDPTPKGRTYRRSPAHAHTTLYDGKTRHVR